MGTERSRRCGHRRPSAAPSRCSERSRSPESATPAPTPRSRRHFEPVPAFPELKRTYDWDCVESFTLRLHRFRLSLFLTLRHLAYGSAARSVGGCTGVTGGGSVSVG